MSEELQHVPTWITGVIGAVAAALGALGFRTIQIRLQKSAENGEPTRKDDLHDVERLAQYIVQRFGQQFHQVLNELSRQAQTITTDEHRRTRGTSESNIAEIRAANAQATREREEIVGKIELILERQEGILRALDRVESAAHRAFDRDKR